LQGGKDAVKKIYIATVAVPTVLAALAVLAGMTPERPPTERFALSLDGVMVGWINSAEGGHSRADVVSGIIGPENAIPKQLGGLTYEAIDLQVDLNMRTGGSKGFYNWIKDSFDAKHSRKNGAVIAANYDFKALTRIEFYNALVSEIGMPAVDAESKNHGHISLKLAPESTRRMSPKDGLPPPPRGGQRPWVSRNFRLEIAGLDCSQVSKIGCITVKPGVPTIANGVPADQIPGPSPLRIPNLKITIATDSAQTWEDWYNDFVLNGLNSDDREKTGTLIYLDQDRKTELARLTFKNLGIFALHPPVPPKPCCENCVPLLPPPADPGGLRHLVAELYCQQMLLEFMPAADE
jgi:hypothetical protein